jgi:hypothetical protein
LNRSFAFLESIAGPVAIPEPEAEIEGALFDALTIMFVDPRGLSEPGSPLRMPWARRRSSPHCISGVHPHRALLDRNSSHSGV